MLTRGCKQLSNLRQSNFSVKASKGQKWIQPDGFNTGIKIYNCIAGGSVPVILRNKHFATWYTCGPTVYDSSHIGHASCYMKVDIIQRILRDYFNVNLLTAMNITDIDDKIIKKSNDEASKSWRDISSEYEREFWTDLKCLNIKEPDIKIRVTENIPKIRKFIENLIEQNKAYIGRDKSVYFKVDSYENYGKLQPLNLEQKEDDITKESNVDFALWKSRKTEDEPSWPSPWSDGRPGWHIECSALASEIFGKTLDFHAGGLDLKFPHHENEEAQSCSFHQIDQWVNYWIHIGHLHVKGDQNKMSKSLKNTISIREFLKQHSPDEFRMACVLSNYRNSMEFSQEMMLTAKGTLKRFIDFNSDCRAYLEGKKPSSGNIDSLKLLNKLENTKVSIENSLKDNFDTAKCVKILIDLISNVSKNINTENVDTSLKESSALEVIGSILNYVNKTLDIFGFQYTKERCKTLTEENTIDFSSLIDEIVRIREDIRGRAITNKSKDLFTVSDELRDCLKRKGIEIKDHCKGSSWDFVKK